MNPGEQPLFSTKAHVFQIDPDTKKNWIPASKQSTNISYYYDSTRSSYRIIGVDGSKAVVNSIITPNMTFTKTSQKFGQWLDPKANIVYGLGFPSELDLTKFIEKFKEIKELTRKTSSQSIQEVNGGDNYSESSSTPNTAQHSRNSSISSVQSSDSGSLRERRNSLTQGGQRNSSPTNQTEVQLKYENDRLKLALAQSSGNAKKWEVELQTLKNNNARLTAALQESTSNVDEWKKQLASYKDDCSKLKTKLSEMEENKDIDGKTNLEQEVNFLQGELVQLKEKEQVKDKEIDGLLTKVENLSLQDATNTSLQARIQTLEEENHELSGKVQDLQRLLEESHSSHNEENNDLLKLQEKMGSKVTELYELHEQIVSTIKKESNS